MFGNSRTWGTVTLCTILLGATVAARADEPAPPEATAPARPLLGPWQSAGVEYAAGVVVAAVSVPLMMELGSMIGRSTPDLVAALVPSLLLVIFVPPVAVAGAEWSVGSGLLHRRTKFNPAVWAGVGVSALAVLFGALGGVWTDNKLAFGLFTAAESLALPAAITLTMKYRF
jgi:hypothetical protein